MSTLVRGNELRIMRKGEFIAHMNFVFDVVAAVEVPPNYPPCSGSLYTISTSSTEERYWPVKSYTIAALGLQILLCMFPCGGWNCCNNFFSFFLHIVTDKFPSAAILSLSFLAHFVQQLYSRAVHLCSTSECKKHCGASICFMLAKHSLKVMQIGSCSLLLDTGVNTAVTCGFWMSLSKYGAQMVNL